jgi:hypothetical protein
MAAGVRFYAPVSDGAFQDIVDELGRAGLSCAPASPNLVRCTWRGARFTIVHDPEGSIRAQLLDDAGLGQHAWDAVDPILSRGASSRTGVMGEYAVGVWGGEAPRDVVTMYDPDLAKFGNAVSPFVEMPSYEAAHLAQKRSFQDRYDSRYLDQPTWADWAGWGEEVVGQSLAERPEEFAGQLVPTAGPGFTKVETDKRVLLAIVGLVGFASFLEAFANKRAELLAKARASRRAS